jgi:large subunit ribosomal protein L5
MPTQTAKAPSRLYERYQKEIVPTLQKDLGYDNKLAVPRMEKIVINMGLGKPMGVGGNENRSVMDAAIKDLTSITGQKPLVTRARKAIANFHIRRGKEIGLKVTLRRQMMYEFLDRLISIAVPRIRDFRGFPMKGFDQAGNYTFGLTEQSVFPEIDVTKISKTLGMDVTLCIKARKRDDAVKLVKALGFPFREK